MKYRIKWLFLVVVFTCPVLTYSSSYTSQTAFIQKSLFADTIPSRDKLGEAFMLFDSSNYEQALVYFEDVLTGHLALKGKHTDSLWWIDFIKYNNNYP